MSETKTRKTPEEKIADYNKKIEQLRARKQQIETQLSQKERKARTRRLIQIGAIFEKQFSFLTDLPLEEVSNVAKELYDLVSERNKKRREEEAAQADKTEGQT